MLDGRGGEGDGKYETDEGLRGGEVVEDEFLKVGEGEEEYQDEREAEEDG